jgi:hypothetical protein
MKPKNWKSSYDIMLFTCQNWKMFRNCPIRIEIITGSHIFILFLPWVVTLCLHFTPRGKIFGIVPTRGKNNINIWLPVIISQFYTILTRNIEFARKYSGRHYVVLERNSTLLS